MEKAQFLLIISSLFLILISCVETENEILEMRVNHHKNIGYGYIGPRVTYLIQEEDEIGGEEWNVAFGIRDFDYQWGYTYNILVVKDYYDEVLLDAPSFRYVFLNEISKQKVKPGTQFELTLRRTFNDGTVENFLEGDKVNGFSLIGNKPFKCADLCDELQNEREAFTILTGTFQHTRDSGIKLVDLKSQPMN